MLYKMMLVTKPTNERKGTNLFGRAKPQPDMKEDGRTLKMASSETSGSVRCPRGPELLCIP